MNNSSDALLKAVETAADLLWLDAWEVGLPGVLAALGQALGATRVALLPADSARASLNSLAPGSIWSAPEGSPRAAVQELVAPFLSESRMANWERNLRRAAPLCGPVAALPSDERAPLEAAGVFSVGMVPVFDGPDCWGLLWVEDGAGPDLWSSEETSTLGLVASLLGAALQRQRLRRAVQEGQEATQEQSRAERNRYARRLRVLHEIDRAILAARLPEEIAQAALERILEIVPCERASVVLFNPERNQAHILALGARQETSLERGQQVPVHYVVSAADLEQGRPYLIEDLQQEPDLTPLQRQLLSEGVRNYLNVPILSQGELIGTLNLGAELRGVIDADTVEIAHEIADLLAVSIHNARLFEAERVTRQSADTLMAANLALTRTLDLQDVLETLLDYLEQLVPYDAANVMLIEGDRTRVQAMRGYERWTEPAKIQALNFDVTRIPTFRTILSSRKSLLIADTGSYPDWVPAPGTEFIRGWVGVPLIAGGRIIGFYSLDKAEPGFFRDEHLQLAETLAAQAAVAIQNARLFQAERARREEAETLREAFHDVAAALELGQVLEGILAHLDRVVPYDRASVMLLIEDGLQVAAAEGFGDSEQLIGRIFPADNDQARWLRQNRKPLWLEEVQVEGPFESLGETRLRAWMGVPLLVRGEFIGYLALESRQVAAFGAAEAALTQAFASQAAIAIQNARLFEQVRSGRERLQALSQRLVNVQEAERRNVARELHDQIGQLLTGLKLILEMSARTSPERVHVNLEEARELVNELMTRVRELSLDLRPAMLDDLGLLPALLWLFERYTHQTQVAVDFRHSQVEGLRFQPEVETAAYRIIQEALTNVARHAGVNQVTVRLWADEHQVYLQVEDRGCGFDPRAALAAGSQGGLSGMRERAVLTGGQLVIESRTGEGSLVAAELPLLGRLERRRSQR